MKATDFFFCGFFCIFVQVMANHGYCKNCFWFLPGVENDVIDMTTGKYEKERSFGYCYMHNSNLGPFKEVKENSYCPDYISRKNGQKELKIGLQEWVKQLTKK